MRPLVVSVSIAAAFAAFVLLRPSSVLRAAESPPACAPTTVHYGATRTGLPHVDAPGLRGDLFYYAGSTLMDGRVNRSDGLVIYPRGGSGTVATKIVWRVPRRAGRVLRISGRRLEREGSFVGHWPRVGRSEFPSVVKVPRAGCWRLSLTSGKFKASVVVQAIQPPGKSTCDATPVYRGTPPHPRFGAITWMPATPRSVGVAAVLFVTVFPDRNEAVIPPGGRFPDGTNTKFMWWAPRRAGLLEIIGRRLDAPGRFREAFNSAVGDIGNDRDQIIFPSIVDAPAAGCWAVTVRTERSAGLVVFQVVPA